MSNNKRALAAYTLSDEICEAKMFLDRAEYVLQEIVEQYFDKYDGQSESGRVGLAWERDRYATFSQIVTDYLCKVRKRLDEMVELEREGSKIRHAKTEPAKVDAA